MENNLINRVNKLYNIKPSEFVENIQSGLRNNFVLANNETKYFLRQYKDSYDEERINQIHRVKTFFSKGDIPVILPLFRKNNLSYFLHNKRYYSLFPYVEGLSLERDMLSKHALKSMAQMLARLHLLSKNGHPQNIRKISFGRNKNVFFNNVKKLLQIIQNKNSKNDFDKLALENLNFKAVLVKKGKSSFKDLDITSSHLIHGDYHNYNLFFDKNDNVKYIFDLEQSGLAPRMYEVARAIELLFFDECFSDTNFQNASMFLREYNKHYPFAKKDFVNGVRIRYLNNLYALWIEEMHYIDNYKRADKFLKGQLNRLKYFSENFDEFVGKFDDIWTE